MNKITTNLWFDSQAEEAVDFYLSVFKFKDSKKGRVMRYAEAGKEIHGQKPGSIMTIDFKLLDQEFLALNGGPIFHITPAVSFTINCESAEEVNELWEKLSEGSTKVLMPLDSYPFSPRYGWLEDKYGVSWQLNQAKEAIKQRIVPSLMFVGDNYGKAEAAIEFYESVFKNAKVNSVYRYGADQQPDKEGAVMFADYTLEGQDFYAMDSAREHDFNFTEATSFIVNCETQEEIDYYWERLSAVPESEQCGWLKDKYGVSWQIAPTAALNRLMDEGGEKYERVMAVLMEMKKLDIAGLEAA